MSETDFAGAIPENYDRHLGPLIFASMASTMAARVGACHPSRVLETAAGTGIVTRALRDALPGSTELIATDLQDGMLAVARTKFKQGEQVTFQSADATALPFDNASFDALVCQFGIMFYADLLAGAREIRRVLVPSGRAFVSIWDNHGHNPFGRLAFETVASFFPVNPPNFHQVPFATPAKRVGEAFAAAGLVDITFTTVRHERPLPNLASLACGMIEGTPVAEQVRARGGDPDAVTAALTSAYAASFGPAPTTMPIQAIFVEARAPN